MKVTFFLVSISFVFLFINFLVTVYTEHPVITEPVITDPVILEPQSIKISNMTEPYNFSWFVPGFLSASAKPEKQHMEFLRSVGVRHVVCLAEERIPPSIQGIQIHSIPVEEFEPPSIQQIEQFIDICEKAKEKNEAVHVHCRQGWGRTGVMLASFLVKFQREIPQLAIANVRFHRPYSIETWDQEFIVKQYYDHLAKKRK